MGTRLPDPGRTARQSGHRGGTRQETPFPSRGKRTLNMDYAHARHAGNAADVHKHVALVALLEALVRDESPLTYVETHAGDGIYPLASVGEWGAGAQRVLGETDGPIGRY